MDASFFKSQKRNLLMVVLCGLCIVLLLYARPTIQHYQIMMGRNALQRRDFHAASEWFESAREWREAPEVYFWLARTERRRGAFRDFNVHLKRAQELGLADDRVAREQTLALAQAGQLPMNDPRLARLLDGGEGDILEVYEAIVRGAFELFETDLAVSLLDSWQAGFPTDPQPHFYRGFYHEYEEQWQAAEAAFRQALALNSTRADARLGLANALRKQNRYREALQQYRICLTHDSSAADVWFGIGECLKRQGALEDARTAYEHGLAEETKHYDCLLARGQLDLMAGRGKDALRWLLGALEQEPHEFNVLYAVGQSYHFAGESEPAAKYFHLASEALAATTRVEALADFLVDHPDDVEKRYEIGRILLEHGQVEVGISWLRGVLKVDPSHQLTQELLAETYAQLGKTEVAAQDHPQHTN